MGRFKAHYPAELKWKVVQMKKEGFTNREIMETLGIKNVSQIKTWMKWYRTNQTHRFAQPVGKQYSYGKGPGELTELEQKDLQIRHLKAKVAVLEKLMEIQRKWGQKS
jgi:transposase-like protein